MFPRLALSLVALAVSARLLGACGGAEDCPTICREVGVLATGTSSVADQLCEAQGTAIAQEDDADACRRRSTELFSSDR